MWSREFDSPERFKVVSNAFADAGPNPTEFAMIGNSKRICKSVNRNESLSNMMIGSSINICNVQARMLCWESWSNVIIILPYQPQTEACPLDACGSGHCWDQPQQRLPSSQLSSRAQLRAQNALSMRVNIHLQKLCYFDNSTIDWRGWSCRDSTSSIGPANIAHVSASGCKTNRPKLNTYTDNIIYKQE